MSDAAAVPAAARLRRPLPTGVVRGAYPERRDDPASPLDEWVRRLLAPAARRWRVRSAAPGDLCARVGAHAAELAGLSSAGLREQARVVGWGLRSEGLAGDAAVRAAALVREAASRVLGMTHHDVQILGGWLMLRGLVAEMDTGEGKTLTATLPAATAALAGVPVHVVTVNDYLAARDAEGWARSTRCSGSRWGSIVSRHQPRSAGGPPTAATSPTAPTRSWPSTTCATGWRCGAREPRPARDRRAVRAGRTRADQLCLRGLHYAIVDEADSVLVDEARTPLILSAAVAGRPRSEELYADSPASSAARSSPGTRFRRTRPGTRRRAHRRKVSTAWPPSAEETCGLVAGRAAARGARASGPRGAPPRSSAIATTGRRRQGPHHRRVHRPDPCPTGPGSTGLHQLIEAKEGGPLTGRSRPSARISYQRFFRRYLRLAGMTGTASEVSGELWSVYGCRWCACPRTDRASAGTSADRIFAPSRRALGSGRRARWPSSTRGTAGPGRNALGRGVGGALGEASRGPGARIACSTPARTRRRPRSWRRRASAGCITVATNMAGTRHGHPARPGRRRARRVCT